MTLAETLTPAGINYAEIVIQECQRYNVPVECVCVLLVKESGSRNVYGHDLGACMTVSGVDVEVTEENYHADYLRCVQAGGKRNGVGPMQLTHWSLQQRADELGGCWDPAVNIRVGVEHFSALLASPGTAAEAIAEGKPITWAAFRRYNSGTLPTERSRAYADHAMSLLPHWQAILQEVALALMPGAVHRLDATDANANTVMARWDILCFHTSVTASPAPAAHFSILWDGTIVQHRNTTRRSSANLDGNHRVISVECMDRGTGFPNWNTADGHAVPAMTAKQVESAVRIAKWAHETHSIPLRFVTDSKPTTRGVSFHRAGCDGNYAGYAFGGRVSGGEKWSNVQGKVCPGDRRITQVRDEIVPRAAGQQEVTMGDVDWGDPITRQSVTGFPKSGTTTLRDTVAYLDSNLESIRTPVNGKLDALGPPVARIESKIDQLLAIHGGTTSFEEAMAKVEQASAEAARQGAKEAVTADMAARLEELRELLESDNEDEARQTARQVLAQIRDSLPSA